MLLTIRCRWVSTSKAPELATLERAGSYARSITSTSVTDNLKEIKPQELICTYSHDRMDRVVFSCVFGPPLEGDTAQHGER